MIFSWGFFLIRLYTDQLRGKAFSNVEVQTVSSCELPCAKSYIRNHVGIHVWMNWKKKYCVMKSLSVTCYLKKLWFLLYSLHPLFLSIASSLELSTFKLEFLLNGIAFVLSFQQVFSLMYQHLSCLLLSSLWHSFSSCLSDTVQSLSTFPAGLWGPYTTPNASTGKL